MNNKKIKGIKKPNFIIFTDKDGTLNLGDKQLDHIVKIILTMGGMVVPITGRTVGDIKGEFKKNNIMLPRIIIGDNGANIYLTRSNRFVIKKTLDSRKVEDIINYFMEHGGNADLIRYTDGSNIYAANEANVRKYYRGNKTAKISSHILDEIKSSKDITKITLAGSKEDMQEIAQYVHSLGFWTDMDKTKFPEKHQQNYRLDIASKNISKGEAVRAIASYFKPQYGYMCIGNGYNDLSMFKEAIDAGMTVGIMENSESELINEVREYARKAKKGKVLIVPKDKNMANRWMYRMSKIVSNRINANKRNEFTRRQKVSAPISTPKPPARRRNKGSRIPRQR